MKVLVVGGYGFIGSHIAEKLIRERYKVTIVDDLSSGNKENVKLDHNSIILDITNSRFQKIYDEEQFDVVIYAANQKSIESNITNVHKKSRDIVGLNQTLELALHYKSKKVIFLSSCEVYDSGFDSIDEGALIHSNSDLGDDYFYQEKICEKYRKKGLNVTVLRLSNVYGPKFVGDNSNIISMIGYYRKKNENVQIDKDSIMYQDYIYVGDVADAVHKTLENETPLILNISSNEKHCNEDVYNCLIEKIDVESDKIDIECKTPTYSCTFDNRLAYETIGWSPETTLEYGSEQYLKWLEGYELDIEEFERKNQIKSEEKNENSKKKEREIYSFLENIGMFIVFYFLSVLFKDALKLDIDVMIIYIVAISLFYGLSQSTIAATLASIVYIYERILDGSDIAYLLFDLNVIFYLSVYFLIAMLIGNSTDKRKYNLRLVERDKEDLETELDFLSTIYEKSIKIKNSLQYDIENYEDSFGKVFDIIDKLNKVNPEEVYDESARVIAKIMQANSVTILQMDKKGKYARSMSWFGDEKFARSLKIDDYEFLNYVIDKKRMFVNNKMKSDLPIIVAPIIYDEEVASIVIIDDVEFENLSLHYINMIRVVTLLISNAIVSANVYQELLEDEKFYENTRILKNDWFKKIIDVKNKSIVNNLSKNNLIKLDMTLDEGIEQFDKLSNLIREFDYIGVNDEEKIEILFSNSRIEDIDILYKRINKNGFKVIKEEL